MFQALIEFAIIYIVFRIVEKKEDDIIINSYAFVIYVLPKVLELVTVLEINELNRSQNFMVIPIIGYLAIPALILKKFMHFSWKRAIAYGIFVLATVKIIGIVMVLLMGNIQSS